ncbi:MAG: pyridoxal-5'-phosphate-dependent protein subunit beta [Planctomycetes bacterium]|nr:pyridoxal-5'-phosphate-dependent protein subunit beta [Planctomycetota bacterium]
MTIVDEAVRRRAVAHLAARGIALPTLGELADPTRLPEDLGGRIAATDPDAPEALNLFRVHWYNDGRGGRSEIPAHLVLTEELTGVAAPIVIALGERFPMIGAHKVLAAYACLVPRLVTGRFDPQTQRAVWPSTGNYCRGGVAISRILGCRGVAVLPEGMSAERFRWLEDWVEESADVVRTPGSESNVKEIYDACAQLGRDPSNVILNQFSEFANHLAHYAVTGRALERVFDAVARTRPGLRAAAFVSATGSAGTIGAGDYLKERLGSSTAAVEALECPTMLYNGFGEHSIQGIGDKHLPLIHNITNNDHVVAVSDRSTDSLNVLFNSECGRRWLERERGLSAELTASLASLGLSSSCNVLACIKLARHLDLGRGDALLTVATDGAAMYGSELEKTLARDFGGTFDDGAAAAVWAEHLEEVDDDHLLDLGPRERERVFNLGYFTWVEQQGVELGDFEARRGQGFWRALHGSMGALDEKIEAFNAETGTR